MRTPCVILTVVVLLVPALAGAAQATAPSRDRVAAAELLFQNGREAMESGNYEVAREAFSESQRLDPAVGTVMNLATVEEKLEMLASAWGHFQHALDLLQENDRRRPFVEKRIAALKPRLPRLAVSPAENVPTSLVIERAGVLLGKASWGVALPVDPGSVEVIVRAQHHAPRTYTVFVESGETARLTVRPGEEFRLVSRKDESGASLRTWGYVAGGLGVVGMGLGVATALLLPSTKDTVDENCEGGLCNDEGWSAVRRGKTLVALNTVGFAVGGVGLISGASLLFASKNKRSHASDAATATRGARNGADVWVRSNSVGLSYGGTF